MALTKEQIENFKNKLLEEKKEIEVDLAKRKKDLDFGSDTDHLEEEADETEELGYYIGLKETLKEKLNAIQNALQKIENKTFGKCEKCGKDIEIEVLRVAPESNLCKHCKMQK